MMLSGAQSALAGGFFGAQQGSAMPIQQTLGGYAAVGAAYFLISALVVLFRQSRSGVTACSTCGATPQA
jgi:hypothetical protein